MRPVHTSRPSLRAAMLIQQLYQQRQTVESLPVLPSLAGAQFHHQRLQWCLQQRYSVAAQYCREALQNCLKTVAQQLNEQRELLRKPLPTTPPLSLLYQELVSLEDEFESVELNLRQRLITVTTERIELEDVDLGPFEIRLNLRQLLEPSPYAVIALDPTAGSSSNPHPHVQGETLCEGDGRSAIAAALKNGLIGEFFVLVRQVLRTYNSGSAYRRLDEWDGVDCSACGDTVNADDIYRCDSCRCSLCGDCEYCCTACHTSICYDCSETCPQCEDRVCQSCTQICPECDTRFCRHCLQKGRCENCQEAQENDDHEPTTQEIPEAEPAAAVHTDRLGQVAVPA